MDVKKAIILRKKIIRAALKMKDFQQRDKMMDMADRITFAVDKARFEGTAENDILTTEDAYGMMAH
jgi:hypothetical protein